jgi:2-dehydro-3-deoxyphosphooctonate aldolase (KDO 8-P synthase)
MTGGALYVKSQLQIGDVSIGPREPLALISGLNVLEDERATVEMARKIQAIAQERGMPLVFKASFDKANRTRSDGFRGPGLAEGLRILQIVKEETGLPILTDVHEPEQAEPVARVADCLQIPAFLCRQTDLIVACAATGRAINIKKGQFVAAGSLEHAAEKARGAGDGGVMVTERGNSFGHHDLVVDLRSLVQLRAFAPVCYDATHSVQMPGAVGGASGGQRQFIAPLARAAVAVGIDALFIEAHADPASAPVDSACQLTPPELASLLDDCLRLQDALGGPAD